jgi:TorA maturation chaperone TorD
MPATYAAFASLWLHEPDAARLVRAVGELGLPAASPVELAPAYTHLFLLNVFPYGDVFTAPNAELNGPNAELAEQAYAAHAFAPSELSEVAAPDHLGLQLAFLDHLTARHAAAARAPAFASLLSWAPAACLAVMREPNVHPFYAALARATLHLLLSDDAYQPGVPRKLPPAEPGPLPDPDGEVRLRHLVAYFLAPARCGIWLSRGRLGALAQHLRLALPFGPRPDVAEALFTAAASVSQLETLLQLLDDELSSWDSGYNMQPPGQGWSLNGHWQARIYQAEGQLMELRVALKREGG